MDFMGEAETERYRERKKEGRVGPRPKAKVALPRLIWCFKTKKKQRKRKKERQRVKYVNRGVSYNFAPICMLCATFFFLLIIFIFFNSSAINTFIYNSLQYF